MNYPEFVAALAKPLPAKWERIEHALLGVIGELGELVDAYKKHKIYGKTFDRVNFIEELGDMRFYMQMFYNEGFIATLTVEWHSDLDITLFKASEIIGNLSHCVMCGADHGIEDALGRLNAVWVNLCYHANMDPPEVIHVNMTKLSARYPNISYSDQHAIERLDKQE